MAGTIQPIAALTAEDQGPINTIVSIVLPVTSALIAVVRISLRPRKLHGYQSDDVIFGVGFVSLNLLNLVRPIVTRHRALQSSPPSYPTFA
jgi:hypothetical protein